MQPKMCIKCKKNIAVLFITKIENGVSMNEGYCLKCARSLGIPQIDEAVRQMGISEDELDMMTDEMELIKTDAPVIMAELNDTYNVYDQRICEFLGIDCVARDKKERLTAEEADANDEKIDSVKKVKLEHRKEGCDLAYDLWGLDLRVKLADHTKDPSDKQQEGGEEDGLS